MFGWFARRRRAKILGRPFPEAWRRIIDQRLPLIGRLPEAQRQRLDGLVQLFLDGKHFEGCGGLTLTEEMRVVVAAQACLLELGRESEDPFPDVQTILIYPSTFVAPTTHVQGGVVVEGKQARLGEAWTRGVVVLAWDAVQRGTRDPRDGHDVVIHEFAHQLDAEDGGMDGHPDLGPPSGLGTWARVLGQEYQDLNRLLDHGKLPDLDPYAAENPPEFFAVVSEAFFERPRALRARRPDLYAQMVRFYGQDPAGD